MKAIDRRELLRDGARAIAFAGLLTAGALAGIPRKSGGNESCWIDLPCSRCAELDGCSDPKSTSYRRSRQEVEQGGRHES